MSESVIARAGGESLGDVTRREVIGGIVLGDVQYAADAELAPHRHAAASLYLVVRGRLTARSAADAAPLGAGAVTFDPEDHVHGGRLHGRAPRGFGVELPAAWAAQHGAADALRRSAAAFSGRGSRVPQIMARLRYELRARAAARGLAVQGLALDLAAALAREGTAGPRCGRGHLRVEAERAAELLHDWSRTAEPRGARLGRLGAGGVSPAPTWAAVSAAVGAPPVPLARAFRARWGCTPAAYVRRVRLDSAAGALTATECPVSHIALAAGYYDQAHFTRAFRAAYGVPPAAYRQALTSERLAGPVHGPIHDAVHGAVHDASKSPGRTRRGGAAGVPSLTTIP